MKKERLLKILPKVLSYVIVAMLSVSLTMVAMIWFVLPQKGQSKLDALEALILQCFIGENDPTAMEDAAAHAMVGALGDRWSYYIPAKDYAAYLEQVKNAYVGVGMTVSIREDGKGLDILNVTAGGPAEEAGVQAGDIIIGVDQTDIEGMAVDEVKKMIQGKAGTTVKLILQRGNEEIALEITRREIKMPVATAEMLDGKIGLITIANFNTNCAAETLAAIEQLLSDGAEKLIFDVRYNPGGYAKELVKILDRLLPEGKIFTTVDYQGKENTDMSDAACLQMPMAVLVNGESYSAAEFFAAALSEYEMAVVVGEKTCGKGYFQSTYLLPDGSAVGLSIGKYYTPKGNSLAGIGITPNALVPVTDEIAAQIYAGTLNPMEDPQILAAIEALK